MKPMSWSYRKKMQGASDLMDRGDWEASEQVISELIDDKGEPAEALLHRAFVRQRAGKLELALLDANKGVELRPESGVHWMIKGEIELSLQQVDAAVLSLQKAVTLEKDNGRALFFLGKAYSQRGQTDLAADYFEEALQFEKDFVMAQWMAEFFARKH